MNFWYALAQRMPQPSRLDVAVGPLGGDIVVDTVIVIITVALLVAAAVVGTVLISRKKKKMSDGKNAAEQPKEDNEK